VRFANLFNLLTRRNCFVCTVLAVISLASNSVAFGRGAVENSASPKESSSRIVTVPFRLISGATSTYTDPAGNTWAPDQFFTGGSVAGFDHAIAGTEVQQVYQSERWGNFEYHVPVANGTYSVNLDFSENYVTGPQQRRFNVSINGTQVLSNFDIYATAGGMYTAITKRFTANVTAGVININFSQGSIQAPKVDGIEVLPVNPDTTPPTAPSNLAARASASNAIGLSWLASTGNIGVTAYLLDRCQGVDCTAFSQIATAATTSYSDTGLLPGSYRYRVRAKDSVGNLSLYSNLASATLESVAPHPVITSATTASGTVGRAFSYQITATNSPTSYTATALPAGLSVITGTGLISGIPTSAGTSTVTLSASNNSGTATAILTLMVGSPAQLLITPGNISFGNLAMGSNSVLSAQISNAGTTSITISQAIVAGNGFSISGLMLPVTLQGGQNTNVTVAFTPNSAGSIGGSVSFVSSASNSPTIVPLSGTGVHVVDLSWQPSISSVVGYNIYRSTVSGGPYTKLNSFPISGTTYADMTVAAGRTYYYVATAIDSSNNESAYSTQTSDVVPSP
jgi:beta-galactosidase